MKTVTLDEAKTLFSDTTNNLSCGETYLVEQNGKRFAEITLFESCSQEIHNAVPEFTPLNTLRKPGGSWEGNVWIADDFDEMPAELAREFGIE